jgi:two-component system sensor histidine kinase PilS (NtrC family)
MPTEMENSSAPDQQDLPSHQTWRPLRLFNFYRLLIACIFAIDAFTGFKIKSVGQYNPTLFKWVVVFYLAVIVVNTITIKLKKPGFEFQVHYQVILDLLAITLLMHASGGVQSGLAMLIFVAVAGGSILLAGRAALLFASIASLLILLEHTYLQLHDPSTTPTYFYPGLLGMAFFATAMLSHVLARRIRESEALAARRGVDLANMEQLTQYVIEQMQTGVAVIDRETRLWQINDSARRLLNLPPQKKRLPLTDLCPELAFQQRLWQKDPSTPPIRFKPANSDTEILPHFARLGDGGGILIFLEDTAAMSQQAQQLKLASLGRLAGSIAHEIRNPLGAISHAGQLLTESPNIDKHDTRLTEIIRDNSRRMNSIIENILQLGRRDQAKPETIQLKPWLEEFVDEFCRGQNIPAEQFTLEIEPSDLNTEFDPSQLHQVLWNLCHNGIRHSQAHSGKASLILHAEQKKDNPIPYLDVIDFGPGIQPETIDHLFEPFFTTETKGTGLGLYIAKELCECNHAHLSYFPADNGGSCFRITFADPRRRRTNT